METFYAWYFLGLGGSATVLLAHGYGLLRFGVSPAMALPLLIMGGIASSQVAVREEAAVPATQPAEVKVTVPDRPDGTVESKPVPAPAPEAPKR